MIQAGQTYTAKNQGRAITPRDVEVRVVWVENDHVHYLVEGCSRVSQTPVDRFMEIVGVRHNA